MAEWLGKEIRDRISRGLQPLIHLAGHRPCGTNRRTNRPTRRSAQQGWGSPHFVRAHRPSLERLHGQRPKFENDQSDLQRFWRAPNPRRSHGSISRLGLLPVVTGEMHGNTGTVMRAEDRHQNSTNVPAVRCNSNTTWFVGTWGRPTLASLLQATREILPAMDPIQPLAALVAKAHTIRKVVSTSGGAAATRS